jgi:triphosphatase
MVDMSFERELKFSLLDAAPDDGLLVDAFRGSPFALEPRGTRRQLDAYVDTPEATLRGAGVALRRRQVDGVRVATLKTLGSVRGALHEREELETPLLPEEDWPAAVLARLRALVDVDPRRLRTQVMIRTDRRVFDVRQGGAVVAEVCFDEVSARAPDGEREALFREAEIEASAGVDPTLLDGIVERVARAVTLTPSGVTKLERAEALLSLGSVLD